MSSRESLATDFVLIVMNFSNEIEEENLPLDMIKSESKAHGLTDESFDSMIGCIK